MQSQLGCHQFQGTASLERMIGLECSSCKVSFRESQIRQAQPATTYGTYRQDDSGTYSPSVHSRPIGGVWVRLTACMTAGYVPVSQSKLRERLERPLDPAGARRAPICLHDSITPARSMKLVAWMKK